MLVAEDFLHSLCFFLWCLTPVFSSFWIRKPSSATRIAKKTKKHPGRTHKTTKGSQQCLGAGLSSEACFFGGVFVFGSGSLHGLLGLQKTNRHLRKTPKTNQMILRMFGRRTFFRGFGFCVCFMFVLFLDPEGFISYWDCKKTKAPQETTRTSRKQKRQRIFRNVWAQDFLSSEPLIFFGASVFHVTPLFFGFWIRKLSSATRIAKNKKHLRKTKKPKDSKECLGPGLSSEALFFLILVAAPTTQKTNVFSFSLYRFVHVSCRRRPRI